MPGTASDNEPFPPGIAMYHYPDRQRLWNHDHTKPLVTFVTKENAEAKVRDAWEAAALGRPVAFIGREGEPLVPVEDAWTTLVDARITRQPLSRRLVGWAFDVTVCSASFWLGYWARR